MKALNQPAISSYTSVFLDVLRIVAAFMVVVAHGSSRWLPAFPGTVAQLSKLSHVAVIVFFVISGYVIAFTTARHNRGPRQYAVARLSRLCAVLLPALLLMAVIELGIRHNDAALAAQYVRGVSWPRYVLCLFFSNEVGFLSAAPAINTPLWSLSFEFWYYVLFGFWCYRAWGRKWWLGLVVAGLIAGPKILLLMPIWLFGVGAYRWPRPAFLGANSWLPVLLLLGLAGLAVVYLPGRPYELGAKPLFLAGQFLTDWMVGLLFALALWCLPGKSPELRPQLVKALRTLADLSFPLYVLHYPLLVLWQALFGRQINDIAQLILAISSVSLTALIIGIYLERQRGRWVRFFDSWLPGANR